MAKRPAFDQGENGSGGIHHHLATALAASSSTTIDATTIITAMERKETQE